jgi:hypothetical protein
MDMDRATGVEFSTREEGSKFYFLFKSLKSQTILKVIILSEPFIFYWVFPKPIIWYM